MDLLELDLHIRPLSTHDVDALLHIQTVCYGDGFQESADVFARRLASPHHCSLGVERPGTPGLQAYLAAYLSHHGKITPLDGDFTAPTPGMEQVLYLHDMSVLPALSGQGVARALMQRVCASARARGLRQAALVSVQGSQPYWERQGFAVCDVVNEQQKAHLATYGAGAVYMVSTL